MVITRARNIIRGNSLDTDIQVSAQTSAQQFDKILSYLVIWQEPGGKVLLGGNVAKIDGFSSGYKKSGIGRETHKLS